ncbi:MAG: hypothetical protein ACLFU7_10185 [Armatimonadota bacterium]
MKNICLVLVLLFALVLILPGCGGGDALPYVGSPDGDAEPPSDGDVTPTPPGDDTPTPPPPPGDEEPDTDLYPPAPPIF